MAKEEFSMRIMLGPAGLFVCMSVLSACASQWKIQGGPKECAQMCRNWDMELSGMVGVGSQDKTGPGATACVCQVRKAAGAATPSGNELAASGTAAGTAAAIVAIEEAERSERQRRDSQYRK
jgi:hypothetical protein